MSLPDEPVSDLEPEVDDYVIETVAEGHVHRVTPLGMTFGLDQHDDMMAAIEQDQRERGVNKNVWFLDGAGGYLLWEEN